MVLQYLETERSAFLSCEYITCIKYVIYNQDHNLLHQGSAVTRIRNKR